MLIQLVKEYILLSNNKLVPPFLCEWDSEHGSVYPNIDNDDKIFLYCIACDYKNYIGMDTYELMKNLIIAYNNQKVPD